MAKRRRWSTGKRLAYGFGTGMTSALNQYAREKAAQKAQGSATVPALPADPIPPPPVVPGLNMDAPPPDEGTDPQMMAVLQRLLAEMDNGGWNG